MKTMKKVMIALAALLVAAPALAATGAARTPDGEPASGAGRTPDGDPASGAGREQR